MINKEQLTSLPRFSPYAKTNEQNATVPREPPTSGPSHSSLSFSLLLRGKGIGRTRSQHFVSDSPALRIISDRRAQMQLLSTLPHTSKGGCNTINNKNILYARKNQFQKINHREIWVNTLLHLKKQNVCSPPNRGGDHYFAKKKILELLPVWVDGVCTLFITAYHIAPHQRTMK